MFFNQIRSTGSPTFLQVDVIIHTVIIVIFHIFHARTSDEYNNKNYYNLDTNVNYLSIIEY